MKLELNYSGKWVTEIKNCPKERSLNVVARAIESIKEMAILLDSLIKENEWEKAWELAERIQDYAEILECEIRKEGD